MNDLKPFSHGQEGTHYACEKAIKQAKTRNEDLQCCYCRKHMCVDQKIGKSVPSKKPEKKSQSPIIQEMIEEFREKWKAIIGTASIGDPKEAELFLIKWAEKIEAETRKKCLYENFKIKPKEYNLKSPYQKTLPKKS